MDYFIFCILLSLIIVPPSFEQVPDNVAEAVSCTCDLNPDDCDEYCCCDTKCTKEEKKYWSKNNLCKDKKSAVVFGCIERYLILWKPKKLGLQSFNSSNLECFLMDDVGSKNNFLNTFEKKFGNEIDDKINEIFDKYIEEELEGNMRMNDENNLIGVENNDYFSIELGGVNYFSIYSADAYGYCQKGPIVHIGENLETSCFNTTIINESLIDQMIIEGKKINPKPDNISNCTIEFSLGIDSNFVVNSSFNFSRNSFDCQRITFKVTFNKEQSATNITNGNFGYKTGDELKLLNFNDDDFKIYFGTDCEYFKNPFYNKTDVQVRKFASENNLTSIEIKGSDLEARLEFYVKERNCRTIREEYIDKAYLIDSASADQKLTVKFIKMKKSLLNKEKPIPAFLPRLPSDFVSPLTIVGDELF